MCRRKMLGEVLIEAGAITAEQLASSLEEQKKTGEYLGTVIVRKGYLTEQKLMETLELVLGIPSTRLEPEEIDHDVIGLIPSQLARRYKILPLASKGNRLTLAMPDPLDFLVAEAVRNATGFEVVPVFACEKDLDWAIRQYLGSGKESNDLSLVIRELRAEAEKVSEDNPVEYQSGELSAAPVVKVVNSIFSQAIQEKASDIHVEIGENEVKIRFRIDGSLFDVMNLPRRVGPAIVSRIKIIANLDIAEKRLPQDGRIRMQVGNRDIDFRVSTLPTIYGEKTVLRVLDQTRGNLGIEQLHLQEDNLTLFQSLLACPFGIILVTGPTGSGKTTTLYTMLSYLNSRHRNIITLEDPVEYSLDGINQVQINSRIGFTFASGLRAVLRQDPNIIMVGEIRDPETARLAIQAAMTGHLVLSTLHTNSAAATLVRLSDMGVEPYLVSSALRGVVAQRLVRRVCNNCAEAYELKGNIVARLGMARQASRLFYRGRGCDFCNMTGYRGRIALQEILVITRQLQDLIVKGAASTEELEQAAEGMGMITLRADGIRKARQGLTSLEEVMKVVLLENTDGGGAAAKHTAGKVSMYAQDIQVSGPRRTGQADNR